MDEQSGQADLQALFEMRRRMVAAFEDIATGVEALASQVVERSEARPAGAGSGNSEDLPRLLEALEEERTTNAQLEERVRVLHARGEGRAEAAEAELARTREHVAAIESAEAARTAELDAVLSELIPLLEEAI